MPIPWVPIALGGAKLLGGILGGKSHEDELRERIQRARQRNAERRKQETRDAYGNISRQAGDLMSSSRSAATERAIAIGRPQDANSFILPAEAKIGEYASGAQRQALEGIGRRYNDTEFQIDNSELNADFGSNAGDYISELAGAGLNYWAESELQDGLEEYTPDLPQTASISPLPPSPFGASSYGVGEFSPRANDLFGETLPPIDSESMFAAPTNNIFSSGSQRRPIRRSRYSIPKRWG